MNMSICVFTSVEGDTVQNFCLFLEQVYVNSCYVRKNTYIFFLSKQQFVNVGRETEERLIQKLKETFKIVLSVFLIVKALSLHLFQKSVTKKSTEMYSLYFFCSLVFFRFVEIIFKQQRRCTVTALKNITLVMKMYFINI